MPTKNDDCGCVHRCLRVSCDRNLRRRFALPTEEALFLLWMKIFVVVGQQLLTNRSWGFEVDVGDGLVRVR